MREPRLLWLPWVRRRARRAARQAILDAAAEFQRREYERACAWRIEYALNDGWKRPTEVRGMLLAPEQPSQHDAGRGKRS